MNNPSLFKLTTTNIPVFEIEVQPWFVPTDVDNAPSMTREGKPAFLTENEVQTLIEVNGATLKRQVFALLSESGLYKLAILWRYCQ